jgi:hypothetical protein
MIKTILRERNALYVYGHENFKKFYDTDAFKLHSTRNEKFLKGYHNHPKTKFLT